MKASIIIRTHNEDRWIGSCLDAVLKQETDESFEVIVVDDHSKDHTLDIVKDFPVNLFEYTGSYLPGKSLNFGIQQAKGEFIVLISGHCIPTNKKWLHNLLKDFHDPNVAGVYGRQEPLSYSSDFDKRDLLTIFGLDKKVQIKDSFFHNANSAIRKSLWERIPFDEETTNIEDRIWAKQMIEAGYKLVYEPEASVYHWHGIHQDRNEERCRNVVRILEKSGLLPSQKSRLKKLSQQKINAIIPVREEDITDKNYSLVNFTIKAAQASKHIEKVFVSTDSIRIKELAEKANVNHVIMRPSELSKDYIGLSTILNYTILQLKENDYTSDAMAIMFVNYPFRPKGLVDSLIEKFHEKHYHSMIPVYRETRACFRKNEDAEKDEIVMFSGGFLPKKINPDPIFISMGGLCWILTEKAALDGSFMHDVAVFEVEDKKARFKIDPDSFDEMASHFLNEYWDKEYTSNR